MTEITIAIQADPGVELPRRASADSAGLDLKAAADVLILPGQSVLIATGLRIALPSGYEAQVRPRSGLSWKSRLRVVNSPGTIDADFRDEIKVLLMNQFSQSERPQLLLSDSPLLERYGRVAGSICLSEWYEREQRSSASLTEEEAEQKILLDEQGNPWGSEMILSGDRIAQLVIAQLIPFSWEQTEEIRMYGSDRGGGFGHSGIRG